MVQGAKHMKSNNAAANGGSSPGKERRIGEIINPRTSGLSASRRYI